MSQGESNQVRERFLRWAPVSLLVLGGLALHARALDTGITSDGWVLLGIGSQRWDLALSHMLGLHTIPLANGLAGLLWRLFGTREVLYQAVDLGLYLAVGLLLYRFARRLVGDPLVGWLAAALWLGSASFYQVIHWPVVGTVHCVTALLYLAALETVRTVSPPSPAAILRFSGAALVAYFTYHGTATLLPVSLALALLAGSGPWRERWRRAVPWLVTVGALGLALVALKLALLELGGRGVGHFPRDLETVGVRLGAMLRGASAIFTLRAPESLGPQAAWAPPNPLFFAAVGAAILAFVLVWRHGSGPLRFAATWLVLHLAIVAAASPLAPRHLLLASLPGTVLLATGLTRVARGIATPLRSRTAPIAVVLALPLFLLAERDLARADRAYARATEITRGLAQAVLERPEPPVSPARVHLIDVPRRLRSEGIDLPLFLNSAGFQLELLSAGRLARRDVVIFRSPAVPPGDTPREAIPLVPETKSEWPPGVVVVEWEGGRSEWVEGAR